MNPRILLFLLTFLPFASLSAADLVVQESGPLGTYSSITAAVTAASDGDRILIVNRAGGLAWQENVTLNKGLTLMPGVDGTRFLVQGDYSINLSTSGRQIRIVGMENLIGDISANSDAPAGTRSKIEIAGCDLFGNIDFDYNYYDVLISSNFIDGDVTYRFGNAYGNEMPNGELEINQDILTSNDVLDIIGNKVRTIHWDNGNQFLRIANNYIHRASSGGGSGLLVTELKNAASKTNLVENNSIYAYTSSCCNNTIYGIHISVSNAPNAQTHLLNNAIGTGSSNSTRGITVSGTSGNIYAGYNHVSSLFDFEFVNLINDGTNVLNLNVAFSLNGTASGSGVINGGHPGTAYTDHDLSRNDAGASGGSFNLSNYFPITNGPRVFHVESPRALFQGATLNVTAEGYDR